MLQCNFPQYTQGKGKGLSKAVLLAAFFTLCLLPVLRLTYAQSPSQVEDIDMWIQRQMNDPQSGQRLKEIRSIIDDICNPLKPTTPGAYNPLPCWTKQIEGLELLLSAAQKDPNTAPGIQKAIQNDLQKLGERQSQWRALPESERKKRLKTLSILINTIKRSGDDVQKGLSQVISDSRQNQQSRQVARRASELVRRNRCTLGCICVKAEGCPCCGYDNIIIGGLLMRED